MGQFSVFKNKNPRSKTAFPFLVDVQSNLLAELQTRVVIPLAKSPELAKKPISTLSPLVEVQGQKYVLLTPQLAGISRSDLGAEVTNIAEHRDAVIAALDCLITGI
jgi:toxin CcdB